MKSIQVKIWGNIVGYLLEINNTVTFEYDKSWIGKGIELSPLCVPLSRKIYNFSHLDSTTFQKLPPFISDSLPDSYGNIVFEKYNKFRNENSIIEKLEYIGSNGMGALEYHPNIKFNKSKLINYNNLKRFADSIILENEFKEKNNNELNNMIRFSSSVGGMKAKALIAYNKNTNKINSPFVELDSGFESCILKFNTEKNKKLPISSAIEYAYYLMAKDCGINISESYLAQLGDNKDFVFITKRFDRIAEKKIHTISLGAMVHVDFQNSRIFSYEDTFELMEKLNLPYCDKEQFYKRMVFNEIAKNYDDHIKNTSFILDSNLKYRLSPAYDIVFSYSKYDNYHEMPINNKITDIKIDDVILVAKKFKIKKPLLIINQIIDIVKKWEDYALKAKVDSKHTKTIKLSFAIAKFLNKK